MFRSGRHVVRTLTRTSTLFRRMYRAEGFVVAPITPFDRNGDIVTKEFERCAKFFQKTHFKNLFVNGTFGEGNNQTVSERKMTAERWLEATNNSMQIILHIGAGNLRDTQELARHAQAIGVSAIAALPPTYHKPPSEEALVEYMAGVAEAAPRMPLLYYEYNSASGVYLNIPRFLELADTTVPTLCGLKHTTPDLQSALACSTVCGGKFQVLYGTEALYLPALSMGIADVITTPYLGNLFHEMKTAYDAGDMKAAQHVQIRVQQLINIIVSAGPSIGTARRLFELMSGIEVGPPRVPLQAISRQKSSEMETALKSAGFI